jgi:hypothetical protein
MWKSKCAEKWGAWREVSVEVGNVQREVCVKEWSVWREVYGRESPHKRESLHNISHKK